jgi:hypothetical protein
MGNGALQAYIARQVSLGSIDKTGKIQEFFFATLLSFRGV